MSIGRKVRQVENLFNRLEKEITAFKTASKLHCVQGCGLCCAKPDIEALPLEFLPWAYQVYLNKQSDHILEELRLEQSSLCYLYKPLALVDKSSGHCTNYHYRGLICRLFGFSANRDKLGQLRLVTCKTIKEEKQEEFKAATESINKDLAVPVLTDYYTKLTQIDMKLGSTLMPVNKAMRTALEAVMAYYSYRPFPKRQKRIA